MLLGQRAKKVVSDSQGLVDFAIGLVRKARESHLIDKAMTLEPHGLNRRDELL